MAINKTLEIDLKETNQLSKSFTIHLLMKLQSCKNVRKINQYGILDKSGAQKGVLEQA